MKREVLGLNEPTRTPVVQVGRLNRIVKDGDVKTHGPNGSSKVFVLCYFFAILWSFLSYLLFSFSSSNLALTSIKYGRKPTVGMIPY